MKLKSLRKILSIHFFRYSLIPIFVVEVALLVLYFSINAYISNKNTELLLAEAQSHTKEVLINEASVISDKLNEVSRLAKILQNEHQAILKSPKNFGLPNGKPSFNKASNGVFYKTNKTGSSLYYSSNTKIKEKQLNKAIYTEAMDISLKSLVDTNPNIVAAYFNTWDDMNRLYPFIDKVYEQYGPHINMEDYNFYFLADKKHNPKKEPVWTGAYLDPAGNGWMLSCIVPIYNGDFLEGVTGIDITIDSFVKNILNRKLPYNADLFMVDEKGMIIAMNEKIENLLGLKELKEHLYTDAILKTIEKPEEFSVLKNKSPFANHFRSLIEDKMTSATLDINGIEYLTLKQSVNETNWNLMILIDKNEVFGSINYLKDLSDKIGYYAIGFLLLFYIIFFTLLSRKINIFSKEITHAIEKLSEQTSKVKDANSKIEIYDTDVSEVYQLNVNFSNMMKEINHKNDELKDTLNVVQELSKAKDEFLANMSHELKTPLNSINLISAIMMKNKKGNLSKKDLQNLKVLNSSGNDLLYLINDVLDISKLEAGEVKLNYENLNLYQFMEEIYNGFRLQFKQKNLEFSYDCDKSIAHIYTDEDRLKQILKNLLSNALKFTQKGRVSIDVRQQGEFIEFEVKDTGIGIPNEKVETIFDRFKQVDGTTTRTYGGTGLGLSICKQLSELLGGSIVVKSFIELGSSFIVRIKSNKNEVNKNLIIEEKSNLYTKKEKIVVFNNDPINFINLIVNLKKDFDVDNISNFVEFFVKVKSTDYKYIILDSQDVNFTEIMKLKDFKDRLIIVIGDGLESEEKIKKNFTFYINKPFELNDIKTIFNNIET